MAMASVAKGKTASRQRMCVKVLYRINRAPHIMGAMARAKLAIMPMAPIRCVAISAPIGPSQFWVLWLLVAVFVVASLLFADIIIASMAQPMMIMPAPIISMVRL